MGIIITLPSILRLLPGPDGLEEIGAGHTGLRRAVDIVWHLAAADGGRLA